MTRRDGTEPWGSQPVAVGVDGSVSARRAVRFAAGEAAVRGVPLRIVAVVEAPDLGADIGPDPPIGSAPHEVDPTARRVLRDAVELACEVAPEAVIDAVARRGNPVRLLVEESRSAGLLVLGNRGQGTFRRLLVGSVAADVTARAACPVAVVRLEAPPRDALGRPAPIVVGVDGAPHSQEILELAFAEAAARTAPLVAVHSWPVPVLLGPGQLPTAVHQQVSGPVEEAAVLSQALAPCRHRYPQVEVTEYIVEQPAADALLDACRGAVLVVVGTRGRGALSGAVLGSVSQAAVHHAPCPVIVVPPTTRERKERPLVPGHDACAPVCSHHGHSRTRAPAPRERSGARRPAATER